MPKPLQPYPRTCTLCGGSEPDKQFPPRNNQCKDCLTQYNTEYQRKRRGSKPRTRMSPEERRQSQKESKQRQKANKAKKASKTRDGLMQQEIQKRITEAMDY